MWTRPSANVLRSGFEITGYAMANGAGKRLLPWAAPRALATRSGFEITGYAMAVREAWSPIASTVLDRGDRTPLV